MSDLKFIAQQFSIEGKPNHISEFGEGIINHSYLIQTDNGHNQYVLQQINHKVFRNIDLLQNNIYHITQHLRQKLIENGVEDIDRRTLTLIPTKDHRLYYYDEENYWRITLRISGAQTIQTVTTHNAYSAGKAFGEFQAMLADITDPLNETIPNFHDMEFRLKQFREAVVLNSSCRLKEAIKYIGEIEKRANHMCMCEQLHREGKLEKRINHCDTKVNNLLFDKNGEVLCVIDLDTTMPGFVMSDFGDFVRTAANNGQEDAADLDTVSFNLPIYQSYALGYLEKASTFLTPTEVKLLAHGPERMTYMQMLRFLTDYLRGDTYYQTQYSSHNLQRTKAQFKLLLDMEKHRETMDEIIRNANIQSTF